DNMTLLQWLKYKTKGSRNTSSATSSPPDRFMEQTKNDLVSGALEEMLGYVQDKLGDSDDLVVRRFHIFGQYKAAVVYFMNMVDQNALNEDIMRPLMYPPPHLADQEVSLEELRDVLLNETLYHSQGKLEK